MSDDLALKILIELREEMRSRFDAVERRFEVVDRRFDAVDQRFDAVDQRFDAVDQRFDSVREEFHHRFVAMDLRQATQLSGLIASMDDLRQMLVGQADVRDRVTNCEIDIADLKSRCADG